MQKTYKEVLEFRTAAAQVLQAEQKETKISYALRKVIRRTQPIAEEFEELRHDHVIAHAMTDERTGALLKDPHGNFLFTKEGERLKLQEIRGTLNILANYFQPHFTDIPEGYPEDLVEIFTDFIFQTQEKNEQENS